MGLNEYTNYSITVFASTVKGDGNVSVPVFVVTAEDSKLSCVFSFIEQFLIKLRFYTP